MDILCQLIEHKTLCVVRGASLSLFFSLGPADENSLKIEAKMKLLYASVVFGLFLCRCIDEFLLRVQEQHMY